MKRQTATELEKIVNIGFARIDQIFDKACDELEVLKYVEPESDDTDNSTITNSIQLNILFDQYAQERARFRQQQAMNDPYRGLADLRNQVGINGFYGAGSAQSILAGII